MNLKREKARKARNVTLASLAGFAMLGFFVPRPQCAQEIDGKGTRTAFLGTWKATCQDGNPFALLTIQKKQSELTGTISIGNMNGANGQCVAVLDPPSPDHAMTISDARIQGKTLTFQGSAKAHFEMLLESSIKASLKFFGTPAEASPWQLTKAAENAR